MNKIKANLNKFNKFIEDEEQKKKLIEEIHEEERRYFDYIKEKLDLKEEEKIKETK